MSDYEPRWDLTHAYGKDGEALVSALRTSVLKGTVEVKRDRKSTQTQNVYVEYECRRGGEYRPSGISTTEAADYAFVIGRLILVLPTWMLRRIAEEHGVDRECRVGSHPTRGKVVRASRLVEEAINIARDELAPEWEDRAA